MRKWKYICIPTKKFVPCENFCNHTDQEHLYFVDVGNGNRNANAEAALRRCFKEKVI